MLKRQLGQPNDLPKVLESKLRNGKKGNLQTIEIMKAVARGRSGHPAIRKLAVDILDQYQVASQDHFTESIAIGNWVKDNITYVKDPDAIEYLQDPLTIIENINTRGNGRGDCDDMSCFCAALLLSIGHQPYFKAVRYDKKWGNYNHIYVVDYAGDWGKPKQWLVLDCILKRHPIGTEVPHKNGDLFAV